MHVLGNGRHLPTQLEQMELYFITGEDQQMKAKTIRSLNLIRLVPDNVHIKCTVYYYYCALWVIAWFYCFIYYSLYYLLLTLHSIHRDVLRLPSYNRVHKIRWLIE